VASVLTLWVTFAPCFAYVFLGAPVIERLQGRRALSAALSAITAAVVGVIANLAVWFALRVLFRMLTPVAVGPFTGALPVLSSIDVGAVVFVILAAVLLFLRKISVLRLLALMAAAGFGRGLLGLGS
jgi:chromate transporter